MSTKRNTPAKTPPTPLLEAALKVIVEGGIDAVRYRSVAELAGVSLGSVSYHFATREELIGAALTHYLDEATRESLALRSAFRNPKLSDVANYVTALVKRNLEDPRRWVLAEYELMVYAARNRDVAEALRRYEDTLVAEMARTLEALGADQPFAAARTIADLIRGFEVSALGTRAPNYRDFTERLSSALAGFSPRFKTQNQKRELHV
ncbi:MAG: TetR family transcriptional regulator [Bdellovibrionales bacterium]|nr:TetR family transcriptional regulator [Bdellovibrionales bacterium]